MLFRENVYYKDYIEHKNTPHEQNAGFKYVKQVVNILTTELYRVNVALSHNIGVTYKHPIYFSLRVLLMWHSSNSNVT
jgi:hypothetical protein